MIEERINYLRKEMIEQIGAAQETLEKISANLSGLYDNGLKLRKDYEGGGNRK